MSEYDEHHQNNAMIVWAELYAFAMSTLTDGQIDLEATLDDAYELYAEHGHREPGEVADEMFKKF